MTPRLLFHVQHLLGVGHVARAAALVRGMTAAGLEVTAVLGGEPVPGSDFGDAEVIQLPWVRAADMTFKTLLDESGTPASQALFIERSEQLQSLAHKLKPDVVVIEHYPFGRRKFRHEIDPLLEQARERAVILCSLRDVLVDKGDTAKAAAAVALVRTRFDRVLVHGDASVLPLELTFPAAAAIADQIVYTGYVVDRRHLGAPACGDDGHDEIVVSVGGGAVGLGLFAAALGAAGRGAGGKRRWRLLAGANLATADIDRLRATAPANVVIEPARPDFRMLLSRAALSISQAGYNTVMDIVEAGCRNVVVPFAGGSESEQMFRARQFESRGLLHVLDETMLTPETLAQAIDVALAGPKPQTSSIDLLGVETTARLVLAMLSERRA